MVLLAVLQELAADFDWKLFVAHFNHQLRGRASDGDERLVRLAAKNLDLPFHAGRGDVKQVATDQGISIEMAARQMRHNFLAQTARRVKCPVIAVAHHADDQVELFFLRLLRGAGGEGLAGMKWSSTSPVSSVVKIARPFLETSKAELVEFAHDQKILFREDATNASREIVRNRLRHELLPLMRSEFQPALNRTVLRLMELVGAEAEVVDALARNWLTQFPHGGDWSSLALALQRRVIQLQLQRLNVQADFDLVERLQREPDKLVSASGNQFVLREAAGRVKLASPEKWPFNPAERELSLRTSNHVSFAGLELAWKFSPKKGGVRPKMMPQCEFFDADRVGATVILRHWRPGDRFQPIGMKSAVKLQDWFTNQKITVKRRRELLLATTATGEIFWVQGLRIGERFKLTPATRIKLRWRW